MKQSVRDCHTIWRRLGRNKVQITTQNGADWWGFCRTFCFHRPCPRADCVCLCHRDCVILHNDYFHNETLYHGSFVAAFPICSRAAACYRLPRHPFAASTPIDGCNRSHNQVVTYTRRFGFLQCATVETTHASHPTTVVGTDTLYGD